MQYFIEANKPPYESKGSLVSKMAHNGNVLCGEYSRDDQNFTGSFMLTYNPNKHKFESCWVDSMMGGMDIEKGEIDAGGKVITMTGEIPEFDGSFTPKKTFLKFFDDQHYTYEVYAIQADKKEVLRMKIEYKK
jgi:hypothetical protein